MQQKKSLPITSGTASYIFSSLFYLSNSILIHCQFLFLVEKRLVEEVRKNDILIIVGETGSGKTTRKLLLYCLKFMTMDSVFV